MKPTIGFDGLYFDKQPSGVGKFLISILRELTNSVDGQFIVFSNKDVFLPEDVSKKVKIVIDKRYLKSVKKIVWLKLFSGFLIRKTKIDFYFSGTGFLPILNPHIKKIVLVHDLNYILVPETMGKLSLISHKLFFRSDVNKADYVISNSQGTANKVLKIFGRISNIIVQPQIDALYRIIEENQKQQDLLKLGIDYNYLLTVGNIEPRKNLLLTIRCFLELIKDERYSKYKLLMVGGKGWNNIEINELCEQNPKDIVKLGYVSDNDLLTIYNGASVFLFPSIYEGFGMPIREAINCGVRVITSDIEELKESSSGNAVFINPHSSVEYLSAMKFQLEQIGHISQSFVYRSEIAKLFSYLTMPS